MSFFRFLDHGRPTQAHSFSAILLNIFLVSLLLLFSQSLVAGFPSSKAVTTGADGASDQPMCRVEAYDPFDDSVKLRRDDDDLPICENPAHASRLFKREDDYSCNESKACSNGACCGKTQGYCGYGPDYCGTTGTSPNDVCWSNCDATAECGRYASTKGKTCPLNVCCSQFGFCGTTTDFCNKTDNANTTCQSNCDQPDSGASDSDSQKRIIGYYEAWNANKTCIGMGINDIPVNALTHLHFAFAYINPGDFKIVPMDGVDEQLLTDFTAVKSKNSGLKTIVSIGGWSFSDNGTDTQPLFGEICGNADNRKTFISNLMDFMQQYAFDGVDFDWEYPGATDRGGSDDDGVNFTTMLKELRAAVDAAVGEYSIAFTIPTSYWYLRHFDLKASVEQADMVNVMSYDLHGVWDSTDPIGNQVLAHTNITEINEALDLLWRNDIPASKLNLGLGFYGRSFQLSDPTCYKPGCAFKGGASPGSCTDNSGTLSYAEIMDIIDQKNLSPYYDKDAQVKYIVWNQDQWVSYDDKETFQAKIKLANSLGLGGLLIWSVDQDTTELDALQGVLYPDSVDVFKSQADDASYWQEATAQDCYVTDCGGTCNTGFIKIENQPCGSAKPVTRHSSEKDSLLCCPLTSAPDPDNCRWRGSAPSCNGHCQNGEVMLEMNKWGDGDYCEDGNKAYCCDASSEETENTCYWTGVAGSCASDELPLTFAGTFLETIADIVSLGSLTGQLLADFLSDVDMDLRRLYCCPKDEVSRWDNCNWYGTPGTCYDNHCDAGTQVQLTESDYGAGQSCFPRLERTRTFCCDPANGASPFLPVPLAYLFPEPPTGDDIDTDYDLEIDDTWGTGKAKADSEDDPDNAAFAFWVMVSPTEIQTSLRKRDGSDWELFGCEGATSDEENTIQMVCTDHSADSNCYKIGLGHGVPGTILEMPSGCGVAKYAVAKSMMPAEDQTLPSHLSHLHRRLEGRSPVVYDLTFDYNWMRVPRDLGDTQVRVDYSNEDGYWDAIVDKAASKRKAKRSLADVGGSHKRWLEEEYRNDAHLSDLSERELRERWFGDDVIAWLKGLLNLNIQPKFTHDYSDSVTAIIIKDDWTCKPNEYTTLSTSLNAKAVANIKVSSSFGMTLVFNLAENLDLSNSYLYLKTMGEVNAVFSIDALAKASFDSGEFSIATLPFPGASFTIPKLMTVGPKFILNAQASADVSLAGHFETNVDIASWDFQQTYPDENSDWDPTSLASPSRDFNLKGLEQPTFNLSVTAKGSVTAHLRPTLSFGITFEDTWKIGKCTAELVVDGWVRARAQANLAGTDADTCPFKYGIDAGAVMTARATAPDAFGWNPKSFDFFSLSSNIIPGDGTDDYVCVGVDSTETTKRSELEVYEIEEDMLLSLPSRRRQARNAQAESNSSVSLLSKRSATYGPFFSIPAKGKLCPTLASDSTTGAACNAIKGYDDDQFNDQDLMRKRDLDPRQVDLSEIEKATGEDFAGLVQRMSVELDKRDLDVTASVGSQSPELLHQAIEGILGNGTFDSSILELYQALVARGGTEFYEICKGDAVMKYKTASYPETGTLYDNEDWGDCNNFDLVDDNTETAGHSYIAEHILERQIIQQFDKDYLLGQTSPYPALTRCQYIKKYWESATAWTNSDLGDKPWNVIGQAWPNTAAGTGGEMVRTEQEINLAKARAFSRGTAINAVDTMQGWVQSEDEVSRVIKNLKDTILAIKYMGVAEVNTIYHTQAERVATTFERVEAELEEAWEDDANPYVVLGLGPMFRTFMRYYTAEVSNKFDQYLQLWSGNIQVQAQTLEADRVESGLTASQQTLLDKMSAIIDEIERVTTPDPLFPNPF